MPQYRCPTCSKECKWKKMQRHWKNTGHQSVPQAAARCTPKRLSSDEAVVEAFVSALRKKGTVNGVGSQLRLSSLLKLVKWGSAPGTVGASSKDFFKKYSHIFKLDGKLVKLIATPAAKGPGLADSSDSESGSDSEDTGQQVLQKLDLSCLLQKNSPSASSPGTSSQAMPLQAPSCSQTMPATMGQQLTCPSTNVSTTPVCPVIASSPQAAFSMSVSHTPQSNMPRLPPSSTASNLAATSAYWHQLHHYWTQHARANQFMNPSIRQSQQQGATMANQTMVSSSAGPAPTVSPVASASMPSCFGMTLAGDVSVKVHVVADPESVIPAAKRLATLPLGSIVTLDCEGVNLSATGELCLLQVAANFGHGLECYLFDVLSVGIGISMLTPFLQGTSVRKFIHDLRMDAAALGNQFQIELKGVIDTQIVFEANEGNMLTGLNDVLSWCDIALHDDKKQMHDKMDRDPLFWKSRPLSRQMIEYAAQDVCLLHQAAVVIDEKIFLSGDGALQRIVMRASEHRAKDAVSQGSRRSVAFDKRHNYRLASRELVEAHLGADEVQTAFTALDVQDDVQSLLRLVPERFSERLRPGNLLQGLPPLRDLRDIVLDLGTRPRAFFGSKKLVFLCEDPTEVVTKEDMELALQSLAGKFGPDNRAGIDGSLHRISALRWKSGEIYGLTLRAGRAVFGNTNMITDVLLAQNDLSVLILGSPGCGKTTIVREAARIMSGEFHSVVVVDTSNEICGDGMVVHRSVGLSRRMVVPDISQQASTMIEAVQNHTPDVIIVDEIGRRQEVEAARTVKNRGVRILGSAHGDLKGLVKNGMLNGLIGGLETVIVSDAEARRQGSGKQLEKVRTQRAGSPVFDVIIELQPGRFDEWRVVKDVARAVDSILLNQPYKCQWRSRDPETGNIFLELGTSDGSWPSLPSK